MPTRRQFLVHCSALALMASVAPGAAFSARTRLRALAPGQIRFSDFAGSVNTVFRAGMKSGRKVGLRLVAVKLTPVSARTSRAPDAQNEKFSLFFSGPPEMPLAQDTYRFEHEALGRFEMFILPVGPAEPGCCRYQAVFNRPVPGGPVNVELQSILAQTMRQRPDASPAKLI